MDALDTQLEVMSNESSMSLDYVVGIHYGLVQQGGFVKIFHGLSDDDWRRFQVEQRGNVLSCNVMGSRRYMQLVRQRGRHQEDEDTHGPRRSTEAAAEQADPHEGEESEMDEDDDPVEEAPRAIDGRLMGLADMAKQQ